MGLSRRDVIRGLAASFLSTRSIGAEAPGNGLVDVRGTRLWVNRLGSSGATPTVYVHGGPGVGSLDFERYIAPHLGGRSAIAFDQRGVLRSDPLPAANGSVTFAGIVDDLEALRDRLGIARWQVLGHSFGGPIALAYAVAYPGAVTRLALECPACNPPASMRAITAAALPLIEAKRLPAVAREARRLLDPALPCDRAYIDASGKVLGALGADRQRLYNANRATDGFFGRLAASSGLPDARWTQGVAMANALFDEGEILRDRTDDFRKVRCPILLVKGAGDHTTAPAELDAAAAAGARIVRVPAAGHFVHVEQPARLAALL